MIYMNHRREIVKPAEGKKFYGSVTVGERGQIVIPIEGRKDFNIKPGDKLLVFADTERGLWIATPEIIDRIVEEATNMIRGKDTKDETGQSDG